MNEMDEGMLAMYSSWAENGTEQMQGNPGPPASQVQEAWPDLAGLQTADGSRKDQKTEQAQKDPDSPLEALLRIIEKNAPEEAAALKEIGSIWRR